MIRHNHKGIQGKHRKSSREFLPNLCRGSASRSEEDRVTHDLTENACSVLRRHRHKVKPRRGVIVSSHAKRAPVSRQFDSHFLFRRSKQRPYGAGISPINERRYSAFIAGGCGQTRPSATYRRGSPCRPRSALSGFELRSPKLHPASPARAPLPCRRPLP